MSNQCRGASAQRGPGPLTLFPASRARTWEGGSTLEKPPGAARSPELGFIHLFASSTFVEALSMRQALGLAVF